MAKSIYDAIDTPALLIDQRIMMKNLAAMQKKADSMGVHLRPHTKTHKMPEIARLQVEMGAKGITVAKTGEAERMADYGLDDIFIANEIVGEMKWHRLARLSKKVKIAFGVDSPEVIESIEKVFAREDSMAYLRVEIETGEKRSGITEEKTFQALLKLIGQSPHIVLEGIFSHEGHAYGAASPEACQVLFEQAQMTTVRYARIARTMGFAVPVVSVGSTPSLMHSTELLKEITEIRPGTYVFMDAGQGSCIGTYEHCAASVLTTIISKPEGNRLIGDAGAKALTAQSRGAGLCHTEGCGWIKGSKGVYVDHVFDEHAIIYNDELHQNLSIGHKVEIIPNHICPVCNLYDKAYLVQDGEVVKILDIACRGRLQ
ncbi:MAG: D-TA family PLP-dependent enzyme [Hungatella sp.]|jgi:D-serine deaminase-like pyridoxal phosphate-dependent protein|nr:D-TA family PLP-dependent enzyme [Hungatella sp.]